MEGRVNVYRRPRTSEQALGEVLASPFPELSMGEPLWVPRQCPSSTVDQEACASALHGNRAR